MKVSTVRCAFAVSLLFGCRSIIRADDASVSAADSQTAAIPAATVSTDRSHGVAIRSNDLGDTSQTSHRSRKYLFATELVPLSPSALAPRSASSTGAIPALEVTPSKQSATLKVTDLHSPISNAKSEVGQQRVQSDVTASPAETLDPLASALPTLSTSASSPFLSPTQVATIPGMREKSVSVAIDVGTDQDTALQDHQLDRERPQNDRPNIDQKRLEMTASKHLVLPNSPSRSRNETVTSPSHKESRSADDDHKSNSPSGVVNPTAPVTKGLVPATTAANVGMEFPAWLLSIVSVFGFLWATQFIQLLLMCDHDFPSPNDKWIWTVVFVVLFPVAPFAFWAWKVAYLDQCHRKLRVQC